jgi:glycine/D-amino acid oxidase-like deaminating enzyme
MNHMKSYTVIGGGLAGLAAANALAGNGNKVILLEQTRHLGGRAQTQEEAGYLLNFGPHSLYRGGIAMQTLSAWKIPFSGKVPPAGAYTYFVRGNQLYPLVRNLQSLLATKLFSAKEKLEVARLLQLFSSANAKGHETMREWITEEARSERVRDLAATVTRISTYTTDLERLSAKAALRQIAMALKHNVLYIDGGWQTLVNGLAQRAVSLGVEIRWDHPVNNLGEVQTDGVVLATGPGSIEKLTGISLPKLRPLRMATLDLGLEGLPSDAARAAFALDRPLYFSMHSASARLAPQGRAMIHIAKYLGDNEPDATNVRQEIEEFATLVLPEWQGATRVVRYLPNMTVTPAMASGEGRPDVDILGLDGVAVAGDWIGEEGMLADAAVASALKAADLVQQRKVRAA